MARTPWTWRINGVVGTGSDVRVPAATEKAE
jgi:hypothetical protein